MEISTPATTKINDEKAQIESPAEGLNEEDELFFSTIKNDLTAISAHPAPSTIEAILNYSRSL